MKKFFMSMLLGCALMCGQLFVNNTQAEAANVEINNQIGKPLSVAIIYYDEEINSWINKGWWVVPANSFKTLTFERHNKGHFWVHMHNKDRSWGSTQAWTVVNNAFWYEVGKTPCPQGTNRRQVAYNRYAIGQNGSVRVTAK